MNAARSPGSGHATPIFTVLAAMRQVAAIGLPRENWRVVRDRQSWRDRAITFLTFTVTNFVTVDLKSSVFGFEPAHDRGCELFPLALLTGQFGASFFRERVKTGFAVVLGS